MTSKKKSEIKQILQDAEKKYKKPTTTRQTVRNKKR
jgi:hypothetical protein